MGPWPSGGSPGRGAPFRRSSDVEARSESGSGWQAMRSHRSATRGSDPRTAQGQLGLVLPPLRAASATTEWGERVVALVGRTSRG